MSEDSPIYSQRIKEERQLLNLSMKELSDKTLIPYNSIRNYEKGLRKITQTNAEKLADFFQVSVPYIMGLSETKNEKTIDDVISALDYFYINDFEVTKDMKQTELEYLTNNSKEWLIEIIAYILIDEKDSQQVGNTLFNFLRHFATSIRNQDKNKMNFINEVVNNLFETRGLASETFLSIFTSEETEQKTKYYDRPASKEDIIELLDRYNTKTKELNDIQFNYFKKLLNELEE